jgi:RNA polymerase sigma-54 factor
VFYTSRDAQGAAPTGHHERPKNVKLNLSQSARLDQRLVQSPQMIQAMKILQLAAIDLQDRIEQELVENPMLERAEADVEAEEPSAPPPTSTENGETQEPGMDGFLEQLERMERDFGDGNCRPRSSDGDDEDRKLFAMQNTPDVPKSLPEALTEELVMLDLDPRRRAVAEHVIWSMDERGYLPEERGELVASCTRQVEGEPVTLEEIEALLAELRILVHPSLGAKDLREALLFQLDAEGQEHSLARTIVADHLDDVQANRLPRIAKATGRSIEDVKDAIEALRHLDPTPVGDYGEARAAVIVPDVVVEELDGEFHVRLERQGVPELTLSAAYRDMLRRARKGDPVEQWLRKRLDSARWFIDAIQQRQSTLLRIATVIFHRQRPFLERGLSSLQTLRMQEVADEVGVHISTVSRAVSGKYAQTPRGIFPLKFFFTGGTQTGSGEVASQISIQQRIKELVNQEDPEAPLSDDHLAELLAERSDIRIARRTVTKYRKMLGIPSSSQRKTF